MIHMIFIPCIVFTLFAMLHHGPSVKLSVAGAEVTADISFLFPIFLLPIYFYVDILTGVSTRSLPCLRVVEF
jgi:uncharacterized membrane protein YGL010W